MKTKQMTTMLLALTALSTVFLFNNCGDGFKQSGKMLAHQDSSSTGTGTTNDPNSSIVLATSQPTNTTELNRTFTVPVVIDRKGAFASKTIVLKINAPEIDAADPMNGFNATITPSSLAPGVSTAMVTVNIGTAAPSLAEHFHVEAWDGNLVEAELEINLTIQPIIRFQITGDGKGDANWSSNGITSTNLFTTGTRNIPFIAHTNGLQVIFENYAPAGHIVHSSGAIAHGNTAVPLAASPDGGVTSGGKYTPGLIMPTALSNAPIYCHDCEASTAARKLLFNANL